MVSIQTDTLVLKKGEVEGRSLAKQRSYESLASDVELNNGVLYLRVKFYLATLNYSCYLVINQPVFNPLSIGSVANLSVNKEYYLGRKKSLSKRYDDHSMQNFSKISRNIISLDNSLPVSHEKAQNWDYQKILSTDQSHSIIGSLSPNSSLQRLEAEHRS